MASLFWVGGTGSWDNTTVHFATSTGGTATVAAPTSADDVFFDANSGVGTVTISTTSICHNIDCTGYAGTLTINAVTLTVAGSLKFVAGMTYNGNGALAFTATTTGNTIDMAGKFQSLGSYSFNGTGDWTLLSDLTTQPGNGIPITFTMGTLNTAGFAVKAANFDGQNANTKTLNASTSTFTLETYFIVSSGGTTLNTSSASLITPDFETPGGSTWANVTITGQSTILWCVGPSTITNLSIIATLTTGPTSIKLKAGATVTVTGSLVIKGYSGRFIGFLQSDVSTSTATISCAAGVSVDASFLQIRDITVTGGATFLAKHSYALTNVSGWDLASYPANQSSVRPHPFSPGLAR